MSRIYWRDKVVLITGGSAGFGKVLATTFAAHGAKVLVAARDASRLSAAVAEIGHESIGIVADVTNDQSVAAMLAETLARHSRIDALINNVGRSARGLIDETTADQFRELIELNFLTAVRCTQAALPHVLSAKGHIVLIGSLSSKVASPFLGAYPASKFPLAAYAQQLRLEIGPRGVHTLLVCPGPIERDDSGTRYDAQLAGLPESARRPGGGVRVKRINPERLSERILDGCERRVAEVVMPGKARWLSALMQIAPSLGDSIIRRVTKG